MAKKDHESWQPLLLDLTPLKAAIEEARVEYDPVVRRRPKELVFARDSGAEAPWWDAVKRVQAAPSAPEPLLAWGRAWLAMLRGEGWLVDLSPARRAALDASVRSGPDCRPGVVEAGVAVGSERPQRVQLRLAPLSTAEWARLARALVDQGAADEVLAGLTAGEVPLGLIEAADTHQLPLLPRRLADLQTTCTCGGARLPCDHVMAVHRVLARKLDREPRTLLVLRGGQPEELARLVARVREGAQSANPSPLTTAGDPFARPPGSEPEWALLDGPLPRRAPLPPLDGWRGRESFDALVRRLLRGTG